MARIKELFIECGFCGTKIPSNAFADTEALDAALVAGHTAKCPKCGKSVHCHRGNMSVTLHEQDQLGAIEFPGAKK